MSFSKIGLHIIANGVKPEALATAPVLCLVDCSTEYIQRVRAANPTAWIVVRWVVVDQDSYLANPVAGAREWFREHEVDILYTRGPRVVYQGLNEIGDAQAEAYAEFEHTRAGLLWRIGAGFGLGAWGVGCPDWHVWQMFDFLLDIMGPGDAILLHEYWADAGDFDRPWYIGRWRDARVQPHVTGHKIILTEIGRDLIMEHGIRRGQAGWRKTVNAEAFLCEVARYNALLESDPDVIGGCGFTAGQLYGWIDFEWNSLWPRIAATQERGEPVTVEPLPEHETARDPETMAEKARWYIEEVLRRLEQAGEPPESYAMRVLRGLVNTDSGLLYRLERKLKGYTSTKATALGYSGAPPGSER